MHPVLSQRLAEKELTCPKLSWTIPKAILKLPILSLSHLKLGAVADSSHVVDGSRISPYQKAQF